MRMLRRNGSSIRVFISIIVFIVLLGVTIHVSQPIIGVRTRIERSTELDNLLESRWRSYTLRDLGGEVASLSVYIVSPTKGVFFSSTNKSSDENTHFRGASTTKMFTAASIMLLNQTGMLNIEDRIANYLPDTAAYDIPYKEIITIRQLLEHRSGVWDITNQLLLDNTSYLEDLVDQEPAHQFTTEELIGVVTAGNYSNFVPGTAFKYSNTAYMLLGKIIEGVSGMRYDQFVSQHFLEPNGLTETSLPWLGTDLKLPYPYVLGHLRQNGTFIVKDEFNLSGRVAEGNIITTLRDLATWLLRLFSAQTKLSSYTVQQMMPRNQDEPDGRYGLGISFSSGLGYGHTGSLNGYATYAFYDPMDKSVLVLSATAINGEDNDSFTNYVNFLKQIALDAKLIIASLSQ